MIELINIINMIFALLIAEAKNEMDLLLQQGYTTSQISKFLNKYFLTFILTLTALAAGVFGMLSMIITSFFKSFIATLPTGIETTSILTGGAFVIIGILICVLSLRRILRRYI